MCHFFFQLFETEGFPPRWSCGAVWRAEPWWGWLHIVSDGLIWAAYTAIPLVLLWFLRHRPEVPFSRLFWMFSLFILACGTTHLLEASLFWWPAYRLSAVLKLATAIVSIATVLMLIPAMPAALALRTAQHLEQEIALRTNELQQLTAKLQSEMEARAVVAASLTASEARLRLALHAGEMGTWDWNLETNRIEFDAMEQCLTGLSDDGTGIPLKRFLDQVVPHERTELINILEKAIERGEDYRHEFRYQRPDGALRWLAGRGRVIRSEENGERHFVGINFDVTERRQTLEDGNLRKRAIESATNGIFVLSLETKEHPLVYVNPAFCELSGYTDEELLGQTFEMMLGPDTNPDVIQTLRNSLDTNTECTVTLLTYRKDKTTFWSELSISPVSADDGQVTHVIGVQTDISRRVETEHELQHAREQAESANEAKTQFLANMSHEIRTPLTAILGCTDTLYRQSDDEETLELVKMVRDQGELLLGVLNDILDVSKIEAGKLEVRPEACSLLPIIADVRSLMQPLATERGLVLATYYKTKLPVKVTTDPLRLRQILLNLTSNAIKYTEVGQVGIHVRCEVDKDPAMLVIDVIDTGAGIAPEQLELIFEPFTQASTEVRRRTGGAGLGLTICRSLVKLLGGRLSVRSIVGEGSRFTVRLPLGPVDELILHAANEEAIPDRRELTPMESLAVLIPCRVLVAEDTRGLQFMLKRMLQDFVASVLVVENGQKAIEAIHDADQEGKPFDLVLMDMQMPVLNGFEATQQLRRMGFEKPIIALTAGAMAGDREKCLAAGCTDYLTKPVDRTQLLTTLIEHSNPGGTVITD